jgi:hypothetical protein
MEFIHPVTGATRSTDDDEKAERLCSAGWQPVLGSADPDESADKPAPAASKQKASKSSGKGRKKSSGSASDHEAEADPALTGDTQKQLEREAVETGHGGLQEDEGATTAPTGSDSKESGSS